MDKESLLKDFYEHYDYMLPHLLRLKGYKVYPKKIERMEEEQLDKVVAWFVKIQGSKEWKEYRQICLELSDPQYKRYREWNQQDFPEYQAFLHKRLKMRRLWNEEVPGSIIKAEPVNDSEE